jgi:hypothetical protein
MPSLVDLRAALATADTDGAHPAQQSHAWGELADVAAVLARKSDLSADPEALVCVRKILLEAAVHPDPQPMPEDEARFNEHQGWSGPSARLEAAAGLMGLARLPAGADEKVQTAVEKLSQDPVPAVRFQVASWTNALCESAEPLMWRLLEHFARQETNRGVLNGVVSGPLSVLLHRNLDQVFPLIQQIFERVRGGPGAKNVRRGCAGLLTDLALGIEHSEAQGMLARVVADPVAMDEEAAVVLTVMDKALLLGPIAPADPAKDRLRCQAWDLLDRLLRSTLKSFADRVHSSGSGVQSQDDHQHQVLHSLEQLTHWAAMEVRIASGAALEGSPGSAKDAVGEETTETEERAGRARFYRELEPVLGRFVDAARLGHMRATHEIVQTMAHLVDVDPGSILLHVRDLLGAAIAGGYQHETLGADRVVSFIEQFVADYPDILRSAPECLRALREILDLFVSPGWGRAVRLTYRLSEIYR